MARDGEVKRAFTEDGPHRTHIGGQALIEGVMMRGSRSWAVAVREPDGHLHVEDHPLSSKGGRPAWLSWPLVRGCVAFVDSLALGFKALEIAANHAYADDESQGSGDGADGKPQVQQDGDSSGEDPVFGKGEMALSLVLGISLGVFLFVFAPAFISNLLVGSYENSPLAWNVVDGVVRIAVFVFYVWLIGRMKDIKRMFCYHGAEHKVIHCYEHGLALTPENARRFPRFHVRCGTAFLIMVMVIAILVYTVVPLDALIAAWGLDQAASFALLVVVRIALIPLIAGLSYEITVKWAGSRPDNPLVRIVLWPGMQMQRLTTHEPDDSMLDAAAAAMESVIRSECPS